ncbi:DUF971 domain-containing protein [bacterium]|nr:DUF971 domain-containing protein [bacterium]
MSLPDGTGEEIRNSIGSPTELRRVGDNGIVIRWDDDREDRWTTAELRGVCPCATCREKERGKVNDQEKESGSALLALPVLSKAEAAPLRIEAMEPVGGYAYRIRFSDGHSSGIYPFHLLRKEVAKTP